MAQYDNARRILRDEEARIASSATGIYDQNLVILFWQNVEPKYITECVEYLNHADQSVVSAPITYSDVPFTDDLYHLHAYYDESDQSIYRLLMQNTISYFADNWDQTTTKWKHAMGETYASGQSNIVLSLPNVDPAYALEFQEQGLEESYTDEIYLLRDVVLEGEWFSVKREAAEDPRTGLYTLRWFLSKYLNNEVGFIYKDTFGSVVTEINLVEANLGVIEEFMARTKVDASGNWYHDTGDWSGLYYDRRNGQESPNSVLVSGADDPQSDGLYLLVQGDGTAGDVLTIWENENGWQFKARTSEPIGFHVIDPDYFGPPGWKACAASDYPWDVSFGLVLPGGTVSESTNAAYQATVYALDDPQSGRSVRARSYYDEREKNWNLQFIIRQIDNENDYIFTYMNTSKERTADFFKLNMPTSGIAAFLRDYYFDDAGNYYYAAPATHPTYTEKNGSTASGDVTAVPAYALGAVVSGRVVQLSESPDDQLDTVTVRARITWASDVDESGIIYRGNNNTIATEIELHSVSETRRDAFIANTYTDLDGNWYYAESAPTYTSKNGVVVGGTMPAGATKLENSMDARSLQVQLGYVDGKDRWNVKVSCVTGEEDARISYLSSDSRLSFKTTPDASMSVDKAFNVTHTQILVAEAYYGATCPAGTVRRIDVKPQPNGLYDYDALEITTTGVTATFQLGNTTNYFGFHHPLKPTSNTALGPFTLTDGDYVTATHILVGGTGVSTTDIDPTTDITNSVRYEEDGTWSWNIEIEAVQDPVSYGADDPLYSSDVLFKYGMPEDEMRWVGRYLYEDIAEDGTIDLVGEYRSIDHGTALNLSGRQVVIRQLRNEKIVNGKLSYDVYENVVTADLEDNDGWFFMGATEGADRSKKSLSSLTTNPSSTTPPYTAAVLAVGETDYTILSDEAHVFTLIENATKRRKTIKRERKYFVRRPRLADLTSAGIKAEMDAVANPTGEPDTSEVKTFDVIKLGQYNFAVERVTVLADESFYVDEDAMTRYYTEGEPACRRQEIPLSDIEDLI